MTARIAAALREVQWDDLPQRSVYPALHKIANDLAERRTPDSYAESVGRVFAVVATALGVEPRTAAVGPAIRTADRGCRAGDPDRAPRGSAIGRASRRGGGA